MSYRVISSAQTLSVKIMSPLMLVVGGCFFAGMFHLGLFPGIYRAMFHDGLSPVAVNIFWGLWSLIFLLSLWWGLRLKRVAVDGESIYISNYIQEVKLPLSDILDVRENRWIKTHPVAIAFASETPWGHTIRFMPKVRFLVPQWFSHPIVAELRDMVYWAKASQRVGDQLLKESVTLPPEGEER
jgi:hypothetical protein